MTMTRKKVATAARRTVAQTTAASRRGRRPASSLRGSRWSCRRRPRWPQSVSICATRDVSSPSRRTGAWIRAYESVSRAAPAYNWLVGIVLKSERELAKMPLIASRRCARARCARPRLRGRRLRSLGSGARRAPRVASVLSDRLLEVPRVRGEPLEVLVAGFKLRPEVLVADFLSRRDAHVPPGVQAPPLRLALLFLPNTARSFSPASSPPNVRSMSSPRVRCLPTRRCRSTRAEPP